MGRVFCVMMMLGGEDDHFSWAKDNGLLVLGWGREEIFELCKKYRETAQMSDKDKYNFNTDFLTEFLYLAPKLHEWSKGNHTRVWFAQKDSDEYNELAARHAAGHIWRFISIKPEDFIYTERDGKIHIARIANDSELVLKPNPEFGYKSLCLTGAEFIEVKKSETTIKNDGVQGGVCVFRDAKYGYYEECQRLFGDVKQKMILFRIGECDYYNGDHKNDRPKGGEYNDSGKIGHEICNFKNKNGEVFAYVKMSSKKLDVKLHIEKLGAQKDSKQIAGVTVVFVSYAPTRIIGWYKNATVFREIQETGCNKIVGKMEEVAPGDKRIWYYAKAKYEDACLVPRQSRVEVLLNFGQADVRYPTQEEINVVEVIMRGVDNIDATYTNDETEALRLVEREARLVKERLGIPSDIKAKVVARAGDKCENKNCDRPKFFDKEKGGKYFEFHHITEVSAGGNHSTTNLALLCPNCHREVHFGIKGEAINEALKSIALR